MQKLILLQEPEQTVHMVRRARIAVENQFLRQEQRRVAGYAGQQDTVMRGLCVQG